MKRLKGLLFDQLMQGANPHGLALSVAAGVVIGVFPIFGATTILAAAVGAALRLNQPTLQATNYLMAPFQLLLIPVFLLAGERICGAPPLTLNPATLVREFWLDIPLFFSRYGMAGLHGILAWALFAGPLGASVYFPAKSVLSRLPKPVRVPVQEAGLDPQKEKR